MTITEMRQQLQQLEQEGMGNLELIIKGTERYIVGELRIEGSGINSSAEWAVVVPEWNIKEDCPICGRDNILY